MTTLARMSLLVAAIAAATIAGAWAFQLAGYAPCELCLKQRLPYYIGVPLALLAFVFATRNLRAVSKACLALAGLTFAVSMVLGAYHAGVEWGWWPGPSDCTGDFAAASSSQDFLKQLQTIQVVRCDAVALRIFKLSLAGWNAVISAGLTVLAVFGVARSRAFSDRDGSYSAAAK